MLTLVLLVSSQAAQGPVSDTAAAVSPCPQVTDVPKIGPGCADDRGGWFVRFDDGTWGRTHTHAAEDYGLDEDGAVGVGPGEALLQPHVRQPPCVANPSTNYHTLVIYARQTSAANRYNDLVSTIRDHVMQTNGMLHEEAGLYNVGLDFWFRCSGGQIQVDQITLADTVNMPSFSTIVNGIKAQGYTSSLAKYWVFFDRDHPDICGQSVMTGQDDDGLYANNPSNSGPHYALSYQCLTWSVWLHEGSHALGAVQRTAPHSSSGPAENGKHHCYDGIDIMCYDDGGQNASQYSDWHCAHARRPYDCNKDDYFHPKATAGSWLNTHWNLGSNLVRFTRYQDNVPSPPRNVLVTAQPDGTNKITWSTPSTNSGSAITGYRIYGSDETTPLQFIAQVSASPREHVHAAPASTYKWFYRVSAVNGNGEGDLSDPDAATGTPLPPRPANALRRTDGGINVGWTRVDNPLGNPTSYHVIERQIGIQGAFTSAGESNGTLLVDYGCPQGAVCGYRIYAVNSAGRSGASLTSYAT